MANPIVKTVSVANTGGFKLDVSIASNRKAVCQFIHRVSKGEVFCEINNPQLRNKNPHMLEYNDNTCAKITSAALSDNGTMQLVIEPIGPAKHLIESVKEDCVDLSPRANLELVSGTVRLIGLQTYDITLKLE